MENQMFCYQCQETAGGKGCTAGGMCGKKPATAHLQDVLIYVTKGLAELATAYRREGHAVSSDVTHMLEDNLFVTITNANFDDDFITARIEDTEKAKEALRQLLPKDFSLSEAALPLDMASTAENPHIGVLSEKDENKRSLLELITYGLKGLSAYLRHARVLQKESEEISNFLAEALAKTLKQDLTLDDLLALTMKTGEMGVKGMALLDEANTGAYGQPEITEVDIGVRNRPGILISGHDLKDLEMLLEQTKDKGVDVYTHGEMLPAHYYPFFKKYSHFAGNYGNAWWKQREEFETFNGPILMTTNCIVPPKDSYRSRIWTTGVVSFPGLSHIDEVNGKKDFTPIIEQALTCPPPKEIEKGTIVGGFAHNQVFALADKVVDAVKSGAIKKFIVMGGCDGRARSREYYRRFAEALPKDTVILTAGCAKYKYNKLNLGTIGGIPRVLDAGQCNDSYSLALIALKLKEAFGLHDVNDLPIVYNIAWYEQKAVIVLLALLYLGVKNIHLGPTLPAFLSPAVVNVLVEKFGIAGITTVEEDMKIFFDK